MEGSNKCSRPWFKLLVQQRATVRGYPLEKCGFVVDPQPRDGMGRAAPAAQRMPSQRERKEVRDAQKEASEAADRARIAEEEKQMALKHRNEEHARNKELEKELSGLTPPTLTGTRGELGRLGTRQFYEHAKFGVKWLKRYHILDIPPLIISVLKQVGCEKQTDLTWATLVHDGRPA